MPDAVSPRMPPFTEILTSLAVTGLAAKVVNGTAAVQSAVTAMSTAAWFFQFF
jgi:hypothetical protein